MNESGLLDLEPIADLKVISIGNSQLCGIQCRITNHYYSTIAPFYHIRAKERAKYATLLHCGTGQKYGLKRSDKMAAQNEPTNGGIINPLFDGLTYNTSGHFAHCSYYMLNHRIRCIY